jgi:hypothetical protein
MDANIHSDRRLEAEYITSELNPPIHAPDPVGDLELLYKGQMLDPGLPSAISPEEPWRDTCHRA